MGAVFLEVTSEWPTYTDGTPLRGHAADFTVIDTRIDALDLKALERVADAASEESLVELAETSDEVFVTADTDPETRQAEYAAAGANLMRARLKNLVRQLAVDDAEDGDTGIRFTFDGRRWLVIASGYSHGDTPEEVADVSILWASGIAEAPLDGETFPDAAALAATVVVLDDLANTALAALAKVNLAPDAFAAAKAALEDARGNVAGAAGTFRRVWDEVTDERTRLAWAAHNEAMSAEPPE